MSKCKKEGCINNSIGDFCFKHKQKSPIKKGGFIKSKPLTEEKKLKQDTKSIADWEFYKEIWVSKPHICVSCNKPISGELKPIYIEHGLPKSSYPQYRYNEENANIICIGCHMDKEQDIITEQYQKILKELKLKHLNYEL